MKPFRDRNVHRHLVRLVRFLRDREPLALLGLLVVVLAAWGFIELADEVLEGSTETFDRWVVRSLRDSSDVSDPIGPTWMEEAGRDLTALGGIAVMLIAVASAAGFLAINRAYRTMLVLVVSTLSGMGVSLWMKSLFARPRPDLVPHLSHVYTSSFPSGHSMMAALVYLTLAALIAPVLRNIWLRLYALAVAVALTVLVGISRVYMGVHYPTDVLAGWAAGLVWALACWLIAHGIKLTARWHGTCRSPEKPIS
ncbi:Putative undecaprenyl-diphosphatase YbjG [Stieleria neptunia]|uniref:Undecaprenyl-diphosphatase YbjG n=1 Tax=Stieleria neptunia TaxID=2527979 RepID=A0A518HXH7_9BACT|nr:phosphatase PAP2 family protein [Stieleria neptunia]QDV45565.1 Putative undecaprenyl-diphosphatase YbjG [Stieleria neptunia]